ncbi:MAG: C-GCAxxG-C-C family (seleno)protein [Lagierella massiliensis]|nr:C-GCAxxG-C-C family (seleno)protein [Lagierella massiliensis]
MTPKNYAETMKDKGFNCAQIVFSYFAKDLNMEIDEALRLTSLLGGGMGKGKTCGVVISAYLVLGHYYGTDFTNKDKDLFKLKRREFDNYFNEKSPSNTCKSILEIDEIESKKAFSKGLTLYNKICPSIIYETIEILEKILKEN